MKDLKCKYITSDDWCHVNTCMLKKVKNEKLEERAEKAKLEEPHVMAECFDEGCDKTNGCGFCKRPKVRDSYQWSDDECDAERIAEEYVDKLGDSEFLAMYVECQKRLLKASLSHIAAEIKACEHMVGNIGR